MSNLQLTNGGFMMVDEADFDYLSQWPWRKNSEGYAVRSARHSDGGKKKRIIFAHRVIAKPSEDQEVDHINGERLDNRRSNLRCCTTQQNHWNSKIRRNKKIPVKGVRQRAGRKGFYATIKVNGKELFLGTHSTPELAGEAYAEAARKYFGEFSRS